MSSVYLTVLDDQSNEEQFIDVYNTYKRPVYHTAYKIMGDSYLAEDVLQEVFLYVAKNFSKFIEKTVTNSRLISLVVVEAVHTICFANAGKNCWKRFQMHRKNWMSCQLRHSLKNAIQTLPDGMLT